MLFMLCPFVFCMHQSGAASRAMAVNTTRTIYHLINVLLARTIVRTCSSIRPIVTSGHRWARSCCSCCVAPVQESSLDDQFVGSPLWQNTVPKAFDEFQPPVPSSAHKNGLPVLSSLAHTESRGALLSFKGTTLDQEGRKASGLGWKWCHCFKSPPL